MLSKSSVGKMDVAKENQENKDRRARIEGNTSWTKYLKNNESATPPPPKKKVARNTSNESACPRFLISKTKTQTKNRNLKNHSNRRSIALILEEPRITKMKKTALGDMCPFDPHLTLNLPKLKPTKA